MSLDMLRASVTKDALLQATDGKYISLIVEAERGPVNILVPFSSNLRNKKSVGESHDTALFWLKYLELEDLMIWNLYRVPPYVALLRRYQLQTIVFSVLSPAHDLLIKCTTSEVPNCIFGRPDWRWRRFDDSEVVLLNFRSHHSQSFHTPCIIRCPFGLLLLLEILSF